MDRIAGDHVGRGATDRDIDQFAAYMLARLGDLSPEGWFEQAELIANCFACTEIEIRESEDYGVVSRSGSVRAGGVPWRRSLEAFPACS